ncbi:MAG: PP2C family protein-serine/threonine phosphatase, partial [Rhodospirillaceae bacterium]|nr:PP2C family protein-serine/threonine phosphatase [Rhodospirillaceae bacterium]
PSLLPTTDGIALGIFPDIIFQENSITLAPGDTAILYSDGVTEAENVEGEQFELDRLYEVFAEAPPRDARTATDDVLKAVNAFADGAPQFDDITCLTLRRGGGAE